MEKELEYMTPEFKVKKYISQDVITTSGNITPPWGGEIVTDPDFPVIGL